MANTARLVTAEELEKFPDDEFRYELVEGRVIRMSPVGPRHGQIVARLCAMLYNHVHPRRLGVVLTEVGFKLRSKPDTVRAPDVAFISQARLGQLRPGFWRGAPDVAIEVLSPDDTPGEMRTKIDEYLHRGVTLTVVVDPDAKTVSTFDRTQSAVLRDGDTLDLSEAIADFQCSVSEILE
jgi:Uma2 family endonuclease